MRARQALASGRLSCPSSGACDVIPHPNTAFQGDTGTASPSSFNWCRTCA